MTTSPQAQQRTLTAVALVSDAFQFLWRNLPHLALTLVSLAVACVLIAFLPPFSETGVVDALVALALFLSINGAIGWAVTAIGIQRVAGERVRATAALHTVLRNFVRIALVAFLKFLLVALGIILLVVPGLFLAVRLFIVEQHLPRTGADVSTCMRECYRASAPYSVSIFVVMIASLVLSMTERKTRRCGRSPRAPLAVRLAPHDSALAQHCRWAPHGGSRRR